MCLYLEFVYFKTDALLSISSFLEILSSPQIPLCVLVVLPYGQAAPRGLLTGTSEYNWYARVLCSQPIFISICALVWSQYGPEDYSSS